MATYLTDRVTGDVASLASAQPASNAIGLVVRPVTPARTLVGVVGSLATSAATADQVVATYTVTTGKTLYLVALLVVARLTTYAATATLFGAVSLETPAGTKRATTEIFHAGRFTPITVPLHGDLTVAAGQVVRVVCTPSAVTAFTWSASILGYEA